MPAESSQLSPLTNTDNPTSTTPAPRSKIRGFTFLRNHTQSSTTTATFSNTTQNPSRSRRSRLIRSISYPTDPVPDSSLHVIHLSLNTLPTSGAFGRHKKTPELEQAIHAPSLEFPAREHSEGMAKNRAGSSPNGAHRTS